MEWKNRMGLIGLNFFIIISLILLYSNKLEYQFQIFLIVAEAAISIPITLILIERVIKKDRENQWEKVRSITYMTILFNMFEIVYSSAIHIPLYYLGESTKFVDIIIKGRPNPLDPQLCDAISEFAKMIRIIQNKLVREDRERLGDDKWDESMLQYSEMILKYHQEVGWLLEDIRLILIPRVLQLSDDQEVNFALLNFENNIRNFVHAIREQQKSEDLPVADLAIADLIEAIGILYGMLQRKCTNN